MAKSLHDDITPELEAMFVAEVEDVEAKMAVGYEIITPAMESAMAAALDNVDRDLELKKLQDERRRQRNDVRTSFAPGWKAFLTKDGRCIDMLLPTKRLTTKKSWHRKKKRPLVSTDNKPQRIISPAELQRRLVVARNKQASDFQEFVRREKNDAPARVLKWKEEVRRRKKVASERAIRAEKMYKDGQMDHLLRDEERTERLAWLCAEAAGVHDPLGSLIMKRNLLVKKKEKLETKMRIEREEKDAQMRRAVRHRKSLPLVDRVPIFKTK